MDKRMRFAVRRDPAARETKILSARRAGRARVKPRAYSFSSGANRLPFVAADLQVCPAGRQGRGEAPQLQPQQGQEALVGTVRPYDGEVVGNRTAH